MAIDLCIQRGHRGVSSTSNHNHSHNQLKCFGMFKITFVGVFSYLYRNEIVHLSHIDGTSMQLKPLFLQPAKASFCIFSLAFSNCGDQIIGGGSDGCIYNYDLKAEHRTFRSQVSISNLMMEP